MPDNFNEDVSALREKVAMLERSVDNFANMENLKLEYFYEVANAIDSRSGLLHMDFLASESTKSERTNILNAYLMEKNNLNMAYCNIQNQKRAQQVATTQNPVVTPNVNSGVAWMCANCQKENPPEAAFCKYCGTKR